jgi:hypothetical protein
VADRLGEEHFDGSRRIEIAIHENGAYAAVRKVNQAAAALAILDPQAAMSLRGEALRLGEHLESVVKGAAKVALQVAVQVSPVDTGELRANWEVRTGRGRHTVIPTKERDRDGISTITAGTMEIDAADRQPGQSFFIVNSAAHAWACEMGHSRQAPQGMTQLAAQAAEVWASRQRIAKRGKL